MVKTLDRKLFRDVARNRGLLLAILSIVVVGVMCYVTMQSAYRNLENARVEYYDDCRMADFWIQLKKAPNSTLAAFEDIDSNWELQGRIQFYSLIDVPGVTHPVNGLLVSLPDSDQRALNRILLQTGGTFSHTKALEVILNDRFARHHGYRVGDRIQLILNERQQELLVVGTAISSEFTYLLGPGSLMPDPASFGVFYLPHGLMEEMYDFEGACNQIVGRWTRQSRVDPQSLQLLERRLKPYGLLDTIRLDQQTSNQFLTNEIAGLKSFATVLPVIFLVVAAVVLNVLVSRLVRQQRPVIGALKALGYSDQAVSLHFLKLGVLLGLAGGVAGSLLGYGLSATMTQVYAQYFEFPELGAAFALDVHAVGWLASLACAVTGCWGGARHALGLPPAEAMRPATPPPLGSVRWQRWMPGWAHWPAVWKLAVRNLIRQKSRTLTAVFSCSMGAGLLVTGLMMLAAQNYLIDFQFFRIQRSHLNITFDQEQNRSAIHELAGLPHVQVLEPTFMLGGDLKHGHYVETIGIQGLIPNASLTTPRDRQARPIALPAYGLVLDRTLAEKLSLKAGDEAVFIPSRGDQLPRKVTIASIADSFLGMSCYADIDYASRLMGESFVANGAQVRVDDSAGETSELIAELRRRPRVQSVISQTHIVDSLQETLLQNQWVMIVFLVLFSGVIYFGSILNSSLVSFAERQREVATLRAIGYESLQIGNLFLRENLITNSLGTLLGLPIGYGLMLLTAYGFNTDLMRLPVIAPVWIWGVTLLTGSLFGLLAHAVVQRSIAVFEFADALKLKE